MAHVFNYFVTFIENVKYFKTKMFCTSVNYQNNIINFSILFESIKYEHLCVQLRFCVDFISNEQWLSMSLFNQNFELLNSVVCY